MEALYRSKPSHFTFFGDNSVDTAVTKAVAESKINKDLIVLPKKRKFVWSHPVGNYYNYNKEGNQFFRNSNNQNKRGKFQGRGRGGRNSRRRRPQQKSTSTETTTQK